MGELAALVAAAGISLFFYARLPGRLPADQDYLDVARVIEEGFQAGDQVATAPEWAERARMIVSGYPFLSVPDLSQADLTYVKRLWLIGLPEIPRSDLEEVTRTLSASLRPQGDARPFGRLVLQLYENPSYKEPRYDFTHQVGSARVWLQFPTGAQQACSREGDAHRCPGSVVEEETREVEFAPVECVGANLVRPNTATVVDYPRAILGDSLQVGAAVTGEMGWRHGADYTPVALQIFIDGEPRGRIDIPVGTVPLQKTTIDTRALAAASGATHDVRFEAITANPRDREFCFNARAF